MKNNQKTKDKVCLYIATHNKTGLKYFGKTTTYFTQEDLQKYYHGSGTYWLNHLRVHGDDVTMKVYGIYNLDEVEEMALKFSEENNIVESKEYANLISENGLDGWTKGMTHSQEAKEKMKIKAKNRDEFSENRIKGRISRKEKLKNYKPTEMTKEKIAKSCKKYIKTEEHKKNLSISLTGHKVTEITKEKLSEYMTGRKRGKYNMKNKPRKVQEIVTCPHCNKEGKTSGMKRYHFDNCNYK